MIKSIISSSVQQTELRKRTSSKGTEQNLAERVAIGLDINIRAVDVEQYLCNDQDQTSWETSRVACVAGGISRASAFVLVEKPWTRVVKPWEDWWRVELNSRRPKFVRFFELCVHQCTRISDWLRVLKRQSNVNRYLSSFPRGKGLFSYADSQNGECEEMHRGSFGFFEYPQGKHETYTKGRTGESH